VRILLDECVDQRLRRDLAGHDVVTVQEAGWAGKKNGELLALAAQSYDVFLTVDRNLYFQQNRANITITTLVMAARTNRLADLRPLAKDVLAELSVLKPGEVSVIPKKST
jgi:predicted nuclease of predicted toxin-antitoxin system